jgi:hypothetical protein
MMAADEDFIEAKAHLQACLRKKDKKLKLSAGYVEVFGSG